MRIIITAMGLLSWLFGSTAIVRADPSSNTFVTGQSYELNMARQLKMSPQTVSELRKLGVTDEQKLKLEFFFYTDTKEKAGKLLDSLRTLQYQAEVIPAVHDKRLFTISGWTIPISMDETSIVAWTEKMVRLGYNYDCDFDGWGTNPKQ